MAALVHPVSDAGPSRPASLASWLGATLVLLLCLNTLGGWVRLSGSGVAIPQWPLLTRADGTRTLLPPMSAADWQAAAAAYAADQVRLSTLVAAGTLEPANLGRQPADLAEFKGMFWTEWTHRLLAALVGAWMVAMAVVAWRDPALRRRVGWLLATALVLVGVQGAIGGLLVHHGSATRWLFLHQANAGAIVALVVLALLRLLQIGPPLARALPAALPCALLALVTWLQLMAGAMLASSRHGDQLDLAASVLSAPWTLWQSGQGLGWNLLANPGLHTWLHGWLVAALIATAAWAGWAAWRHGAGPRLRLALGLVATFIGVQMLLGIMSVDHHDAYVSLAHQFAGISLLCAGVLAWFDARHEAPAPPDPAGEAA